MAWRLPDEYRHFQETSFGHVCIAGRNSWTEMGILSNGRLVDERIGLVFSRTACGIDNTRAAGAGGEDVAVSISSSGWPPSPEKTPFLHRGRDTDDVAEDSPPRTLLRRGDALILRSMTDFRRLLVDSESSRRKSDSSGDHDRGSGRPQDEELRPTPAPDSTEENGGATGVGAGVLRLPPETKKLFLIGGSGLVSEFFRAKLIDEFLLSLIREEYEGDTKLAAYAEAAYFSKVAGGPAEGVEAASGAEGKGYFSAAERIRDEDEFEIWRYYRE